MFGILGIAVLIIIMLLRVPIAFAMAFVGLVGFAYAVSLEASLRFLVKTFFSVFSSYSLTVLPLFMLMGQIASNSGISKRLYATANAWLGHVPGGLAIATVGANALFATVSGSTNASAATMSSIAIPEMRRYNYSERLASGTVAASGSLGILIPPSSIFIIYGIVTEQSIGKLFMAGIVPGIILSLLFIGTIWLWVRRNPALGLPGHKSTLRERLKTLLGTVDTLFIFLFVMGGLVIGYFTPSEAAGVGAGITLVVALASRQMSWRQFADAVVQTVTLSVMVMVIVAGAMMFGNFLAITRLPHFLAYWVGTLPFPPWAIMAVIVTIYFLGGMFMDSLAMILLTIPIFFPVVVTLGYDPIWFGVLIVLVVELGVITPPVGINVFVVSSVSGIPLETIFRGCVPFVVALAIMCGIIIAYPEITLFLPRLLK